LVAHFGGIVRVAFRGGKQKPSGLGACRCLWYLSCFWGTETGGNDAKKCTGCGSRL
jgi:hypothetical protein